MTTAEKNELERYMEGRQLGCQNGSQRMKIVQGLVKKGLLEYCGGEAGFAYFKKTQKAII